MTDGLCTNRISKENNAIFERQKDKEKTFPGIKLMKKMNRSEKRYYRKKIIGEEVWKIQKQRNKEKWKYKVLGQRKGSGENYTNIKSVVEGGNKGKKVYR